MADIWNSGAAGNSAPPGYGHLYTVGEVCAMLGITRKTLFYYDRIGLAVPTARIGPQSHKVYDSEALKALKRIAEYREAGLSIEEIRILQGADRAEKESVLACARDRLLEEKAQLEIKIGKLEQMMHDRAL